MNKIECFKKDESGISYVSILIIIIVVLSIISAVMTMASFYTNAIKIKKAIETSAISVTSDNSLNCYNNLKKYNFEIKDSRIISSNAQMIMYYLKNNLQGSKLVNSKELIGDDYKIKLIKYPTVESLSSGSTIVVSVTQYLNFLSFKVPLKFEVKYNNTRQSKYIPTF